MASGKEKRLIKQENLTTQYGDWNGEIWLSGYGNKVLLSVGVSPATVTLDGVTYIVVATPVANDIFLVQFVAEGRTPLLYTQNHQVGLNFRLYYLDNS